MTTLTAGVPRRRSHVHPAIPTLVLLVILAGQTTPTPTRADDPPPTREPAPSGPPTSQPPPATQRHRPKLPKGFVSREIELPNGKKHKYVVFIPPQYAIRKDHRFPVVLFLHGSGECGTDGLKHTTIGLPKLLAAAPKNYPFIVVMPQAKDMWFRGENLYAAWAALEATLNKYRTDPERIYLTGLSMGGFGVWEMAIARPDVFAAIVPVCGVAPVPYVSNLVHLPVWAFHGALDKNVPVQGSREPIAELRRLGAAPRYTEYPEADHFCWDQAYSTPELWKWLLEQKRAAPPRELDYRLPPGSTQQVWWLLAKAAAEPKAPAHIHVTIGENGEVVVQSEGVMAWAIRSETQPLKIGDEVTATWNGNQVFQGTFQGGLAAQSEPQQETTTTATAPAERP